MAVTERLRSICKLLIVILRISVILCMHLSFFRQMASVMEWSITAEIVAVVWVRSTGS